MFPSNKFQFSQHLSATEPPQPNRSSKMVSNQTTTATNNPYNLCHCVNKLLLTHKPVKGAIQSHPNFPAQLMQNISSMAAFQHQQYQLAAHLRTNRATTRQNKRHQPLPTRTQEARRAPGRCPRAGPAGRQRALRRPRRGEPQRRGGASWPSAEPAA